MSYLSVNPFVYEYVNADNITVIAENVLAKQYTDTKGLFLGMFVAIASIELYCWLGRQERLKLKKCQILFPPMYQKASQLYFQPY
jgi:PTS system cellobiose-specific IIC component